MKEKMMDTNYAFKNSENVFVPKQYTEEKKRTTLLLCIFGGWLGIHRFYAGHYKMGVLYFLTAGVFFVGWIRDIVCLMNGSFFEKYDVKQHNKAETLRIQKEMYEKYQLNPTPFHILAKEISAENKKMEKAVEKYVDVTGLDLKTARRIMFPNYLDGKTPEEVCGEQKEINRQNKEQFWSSLETLSNLSSSSKVVKCPKCHSTSISYQDKISIGRAIVGGTVAGKEGAVLGGLTGGKGYAVCLNCGKRWKI